MWVIILVLIGGFLLYRFGVNSGDAIASARVDGGMRNKYAKLVNHILEGHKDAKILTETRTYLRVGVSNYGGSTMFHIQQTSNNAVIIDYDVSDNPLVGSFSLRFTFPDNMDQDEMMVQIGLGVQRKMLLRTIGGH